MEALSTRRRHPRRRPPSQRGARLLDRGRSGGRTVPTPEPVQRRRSGRVPRREAEPRVEAVDLCAPRNGRRRRVLLAQRGRRRDLRRRHDVLRSPHHVRHGLGAGTDRPPATHPDRRGDADRVVRTRRASVGRAGAPDRAGFGSGARRRAAHPCSHARDPLGGETTPGHPGHGQSDLGFDGDDGPRWS